MAKKRDDALVLPYIRSYGLWARPLRSFCTSNESHGTAWQDVAPPGTHGYTERVNCARANPP
jgi:hypothetical protein